MVRLFCYEGTNFGDAMSKRIVAKLSNKPVTSSRFEMADIMAVGSVFYRGDYLIREAARSGITNKIKGWIDAVNCSLRSPIIVWGSGFIQQPNFVHPIFRRRIDIRAVRGKHTLQILKALGLADGSDNIAYGDPGLLYSRLFGFSAAPTFNLGIVLHRFDETVRERIGETLNGAGILHKFIDVKGEPDEVVRDIASCRVVCSSSLHGLIVADSFGIPNCHLEVTTLGLNQDDFLLKFKDYYSAFEENMPPCLTLEELLQKPERIFSDDKLHRMAVERLKYVQERLIESFPNEL